MKVTIKFKKSNEDILVSKYRLYRSNSPEGLYASENVVAEITDFAGTDVIEYIDSSASLAVEYYYGLETVSKEGYSVLSPAQYVCVHRNEGAFDYEILVGDREAGYCKHDYSSLNHLIVDIREDLNSGKWGIPSNVSSSMSSSMYDRPYVYGFYKGKSVVYAPYGFFSSYMSPSSFGVSTSDEMLSIINQRITQHFAEKVFMLDGVEYRARLISKEEWDKMFALSMFMSGTDNNQRTTGFAGRSRGVCPTLTGGRYIASSTEYLLLRSDESKLDVYKNGMSSLDIFDFVLDRPTGASTAIHMLVPLAFEPVQI